jgi:hypothetical protein
MNVKDTFKAMMIAGGRSTEKHLLGQPGGYQVMLRAGIKGKYASDAAGSMLSRPSLTVISTPAWTANELSHRPF